MQFPQHKCGLYLSHNEHRHCYQKLGDFINSEWLRLEFANDESRKRAIETDELWVLQWYPETPIGFYRIAAPTIEELLQWANEMTLDTKQPLE